MSVATVPLLPLLPEGITYRGAAQHGPDESKEQAGNHSLTILWARYSVHGVNVDIGWTVDPSSRRYREPNRILIESGAYDRDSIEKRHASKRQLTNTTLPGISKSVLMAIPMAHALGLMKSRHEQLSFEHLRAPFPTFPKRLKGEMDYLIIVMAYVHLVAAGSEEPIKRLAEWSGESPDTWSARLRRARHKGYLIGKGRDARRGPELDKFVHGVRANASNSEKLTWL